MILYVFIVSIINHNANAQPSPSHNLRFDSLAGSWDEAIPLGNATLGALIWKKDGELRFSIDRSDLWDLRPMRGLHGPRFSFAWIRKQVEARDYGVVQEQFDAPYEREPAPSKIPGAALQVPIKNWGNVTAVELDIASGVCSIRWSSGILLESFIHATKPVGWIRVHHLGEVFDPRIVPPAYSSSVTSGGGSVEGDDLNRLGYEQGQVRKISNGAVYTQKGWGGFSYETAIAYRRKDSLVELAWSISSHGDKTAQRRSIKAEHVIADAMKRTLDTDLASHKDWWSVFWSKSSISVPDDTLEKQWYLEQYKFGSAARADAPPISLQAVWTADNGRLPPWKGDFHHDLNTQLSYWPSYSANHLEEAIGYYNHLDKNKKNYLRYTREFYNVRGLNVPGVTTLDGTEMGGWIQYSGSPTISAWLAHNYYLQWKYSMDEQFLRRSAYPWVKETAEFLAALTSKDSSGVRQLPLSSSPEIYNNSIDAWFLQNTNYDLALMRFVFSAAAEMAAYLDITKDEKRWKEIGKEFGDYALSSGNELLFAPGKPYNESHRHFSNMMAIHPLSLIRWEEDERSREIIRNSIRLLDSVGPDWWCGYSYSWMANLKARMKDGEGAAEALSTFARAFCLPNSFHVNGDQTKSGYSKFVYRPFTLEGILLLQRACRKCLSKATVALSKYSRPFP
jgi:alpha-L-fucosidase 2